jgi:hypothetical protein
MGGRTLGYYNVRGLFWLTPEKPPSTGTSNNPRRSQMKSIAQMTLLLTLALVSATAVAQNKKLNKRIYIPIPERKREFVPPEQVGVLPDCPFPTVKERIVFKCPTCGLKMSTHVLYPHLPHCPKDESIMFEEEKTTKESRKEALNKLNGI